MALPPGFAGSVQRTVTTVLPGLADTLVGAPGTVEPPPVLPLLELEAVPVLVLLELEALPVLVLLELPLLEEAVLLAVVELPLLEEAELLEPEAPDEALAVVVLAVEAVEPLLEEALLPEGVALDPQPASASAAARTAVHKVR